MLFQQRSPLTWYHHLFTRLGALLLLGLTLLLAACGGSSSTTTTGGTGGTTCPSTKSLTGAGSTFDYPLFSKIFTVYPTVKCGANVNYQSVGSGAGINDLLNNIVAFGATDTPLTDAQIAQSTHGTVLHIPVTLGATAISYNLSSIPSGTLKLTGPIIADIYLGKIKTWNDPAITKINTGVNLPNQNITVVHRSDGSGTCWVPGLIDMCLRENPLP